MTPGRRIFKYATGDHVPPNSKYLATVAQTRIEEPPHEITYAPTAQHEEYTAQMPGYWQECWLVWHYYEVEQ